MAYDRKRSKLMAECSEQTYAQYRYDGDFKVPKGYEKVAEFTARQLVFEGSRSEIREQQERFLLHFRDQHQQMDRALDEWQETFESQQPTVRGGGGPPPSRLIGALEDLDFESRQSGGEGGPSTRGAAALEGSWLDGWPVRCKKVFCGFALRPTADNEDPDRTGIIALRGTLSATEVLVDATALQVNYDWRAANGQVHLGFYAYYRLFLTFQVVKSLIKLWDVPVCVTGHSLGGALATLAARDVRRFNRDVQLYSYASPRVGDKNFKTYFESKVPRSFRVANLADVAPTFPPTEITLGGKTYRYAHVGEEWSYLWQTGDLLANHRNYDNYQVAVEREVESDRPRKYPTSG